MNPLRHLRINNVVWIVVDYNTLRDFTFGYVSQILYGSVPLNQFRLQYPAWGGLLVDHGSDDLKGDLIAHSRVNTNAVKSFGAEVEKSSKSRAGELADRVGDQCPFEVQSDCGFVWQSGFSSVITS